MEETAKKELPASAVVGLFSKINQDRAVIDRHVQSYVTVIMDGDTSLKESCNIFDDYKVVHPWLSPTFVRQCHLDDKSTESNNNITNDQNISTNNLVPATSKIPDHDDARSHIVSCITDDSEAAHDRDDLLRSIDNHCTNEKNEDTASHCSISLHSNKSRSTCSQQSRDKHSNNISSRKFNNDNKTRDLSEIDVPLFSDNDFSYSSVDEELVSISDILANKKSSTFTGLSMEDCSSFESKGSDPPLKQNEKDDENDGNSNDHDEFDNDSFWLNEEDLENADDVSSSSSSIMEIAVEEQRRNPFIFSSRELTLGYDGPTEDASLSTLLHLDLYFRCYVFPDAQQRLKWQQQQLKLDELFEKEDDRKLLLRPRIQLPEFDWNFLHRTEQLRRRLLTAAAGENALKNRHSHFDINNDDDECVGCESFIQLWTEDVCACSTAARTRMPPKITLKLAFHGDIVLNPGIGIATCSEGRQTILCLSNQALYIIPKDEYLEDGQLSTNNENKMERQFPSPIPKLATFGDGFWPHAVARHSLETLTRITIGFQFQRLILHFTIESKDLGPVHASSTRNNNNACTLKREGSGKLECSYIILTCNKQRSVNMVQKLQLCAKEAKLQFVNSAGGGIGGILPSYPLGNSASGLLQSSSSSKVSLSIDIDNDDKYFLDALGIAVAESMCSTKNKLGVVLHYQIVRQQWKSFQRNAVRRVCVVTDTHIYLLDEDYFGDGSSSKESCVKSNNSEMVSTAGQVNLRCVDSSDLNLVAEIRAADEDPCQITLVMKAIGLMSRPHRWRLICRDGQGAEQLVDSVRRSIRSL